MSISSITDHKDLALAVAASTSSPKPSLPKGKARAHSRFVLFLRVLLPLLMIGVLSLLTALVVQHAVKRQAAAHQDATTPIRMTNPHFFGRDNQGRAFTLGAREAARDERSLQVVLLAVSVPDPGRGRSAPAKPHGRQWRLSRRHPHASASWPRARRQRGRRKIRHQPGPGQHQDRHGAADRSPSPPRAARARCSPTASMCTTRARRWCSRAASTPS